MSHTQAPGDDVDHDAQMRDVMRDVREDRDEIRRLTAAQIVFVAWLKEREQWLTNEISGGGNWEHLNARRSECACIRERFERLSLPDTGANK